MQYLPALCVCRLAVLAPCNLIARAHTMTCDSHSTLTDGGTLWAENPSGQNKFKDIYIITDLMDTDLHRIIRSSQVRSRITALSTGRQASMRMRTSTGNAHTHAIRVNDLPCEKTAANFG